MYNSYECNKCGNIISVMDDKCPYCGNIRSYSSSREKTSFSSYSNNNSSSTPSKNETNLFGKINWVLFIILLIIFPPAAIIYIVIKVAEWK